LAARQYAQWDFENTAVAGVSRGFFARREERDDAPTALLSIIDCTLLFVAADAIVEKKREKNMVAATGDLLWERGYGEMVL
jgi:hypothetical protein